MTNEQKRQQQRELRAQIRRLEQAIRFAPKDAATRAELARLKSVLC